ncbi:MULTISPECIES: hypothetical protein [Arcicella]|uniref:Uncharacterized protein n=1 Tax=Arcicella lustrica TaxID=2984196 RepID=A0ABU5SG51_9BACT|nr:hypothetical protein [Arcicella sp. DC25W]MEA5426244.1 hypothetical protein [Arcicella sp. DC25W]
MSASNKISAVLNEADKIAAIAFLQQAKDQLPFLISTPADQSPSRVMGSKSVEYVLLCLEGAKSYPNKMTGDFDTEEFEKDVVLISQLRSVKLAVADLLDRIDDTMLAASADAMIASDKVYKLLKVACKEDGSMKDLVDRIAQRYKRPSSKKPKKDNNQ